MRVLLVSDCHSSQICGVTRKQNELVKQLRLKNHIPKLLSSDMFYTFSAPYFREVRLVIPNPLSYLEIVKCFNRFDPEIICIMTEGTLGLMAALHCNLKGIPYTTMRCTQLENYIPYFNRIIKTYLDCFHSLGEICITPSPTLSKTYNHKAIGILNGCNTKEFTINGEYHKDIVNLPSPKWLYVGRIGKEKNIDAFTQLSDVLGGSFIIVGSGPYLSNMIHRKNIYYLGWKHGDELARIYRSCDIFVFPSKTDTFGQVMVEAMASGLPVAAYPVIGPVDVVKNGVTGYLDQDLKVACHKASRCDPEICVAHAKTFSWGKMCERFLDCQVVCDHPKRDFIYLQIFILLIFAYCLSES